MSASLNATPWLRPIVWPNWRRVGGVRARPGPAPAGPGPGSSRRPAAGCVPSQVLATSKPRPTSPSTRRPGHPAAVEDEHGVAVAAVRHAAVAGQHGEPRRVESTRNADLDAARRSPPLGGREQDHEVGRVGVADEVLGAGDHASRAPSRTARVRMPRRSEPASGSVIARQSVRSPRHRRQEVALALVARAGQQDLRRPGDGQHLQRVAGVPELALHQHPGQRVEAAAADLLGHVGGVEPGPDRRVAQLGAAARGRARRCAPPRPRAAPARAARTPASSPRRPAARPSARDPRRSPHGDAAGRVLRGRHQQRLGAGPQRRRGTGSPAPRPCRRARRGPPRSPAAGPSDHISCQIHSSLPVTPITDERTSGRASGGHLVEVADVRLEREQRRAPSRARYSGVRPSATITASVAWPNTST